MSLIDLVLRISERAYQDFYPTYLKLEFVENTSMYLKNFGKKIHKKKSITKFHLGISIENTPNKSPTKKS